MNWQKKCGEKNVSKKFDLAEMFLDELNTYSLPFLAQILDTVKTYTLVIQNLATESRLHAWKCLILLFDIYS